MSILRPNQPTSTVSHKLLGMNPQTSLYGTCIPILYGTQRIQANVIWFGDWRANPVQSGGKGGSKGSSKGGGDQQYTYQCALAMALCVGPIVNIGHVWMDKTKMQLVHSSFNYIIPPSASITVPQGAAAARDRGVAVQTPYNVITNDYGNPKQNFTLSGIQFVPMNGTAIPVLGPGQYRFDANTGTYTFAAADIGKTVSLTYEWNDSNSSVLGAPQEDLNFVLLVGTPGQGPWGYLQTNHPSQALGYTNLAYLATPLMDLGTSGMVSNYNWEVFGKYQFGGGIIDCNPADIVSDFLTNLDYGCQWPSAELGDLSELSNYALANGIFLSPLLDTQRPAATWLDEWLDVCNCVGFYSEGKIKVRSYGDTSAVGNGAVYTPYNTPIYDLDFDDYIDQEQGSPFTVDRSDVYELDNQVTVEWINRGNDYHPEPVYQLDEWHVQKYGLHAKSTVSAHSVLSAATATKYATTLLKRGLYVRNTSKDIKIQLTAGALLEPMDMVTITNPYIGWWQQPVRILSIEEDDNYILTLEVEEFPWGNATPALYGKQVTGSFGPGYFEPPGSVHAPIFFEPTIEMNPGKQFEMTIGLSGSQKWGGADVYVSVDGTSYNLVGRQTGTSNMGVTTTALSPHVDPDNSGTFGVNVTNSGVQLLTVSADQKDALISLLLVGRELIAYQNATLTASHTYTLSILRRGCYGTPIENHPAGTPIELFDDSLYVWRYKPADVGRQHWFKFTSVNRSGTMEEDISKVYAYPYYVEGPRRPYPLHSMQEVAVAGDPWYAGGSFAIQPKYIKLAGGRGNMARVLFTFLPTTPASMSVTAPPVFTLSTSTSGGTLPGNTWIAIGMTAIQQSGDNLETMLSPLTAIKTGSGNSNSVTINYTCNAPSLDTAQVYAAYPDDSEGMWARGTLSPGTTSFLLQNLPAIGTGPPDPLAASYIMRGCWELHAGIWAAAVNFVGPNTLRFIGCNFAANSLTNRFISLIGKYDNTNTTPIADARIVSNTTDTITTDIDLSQFGIVVGDVFTIRTQATSAGSNYVTDSLWINGGSGQAGTGLAVDQEKGKVIWIIAGQGAGQFRTIKHNDATTIYTTEPWNVVPTGASFIVIEPGWSYAATSKAAGAVINSTSITYPLQLSNLSQTYIFQILTVDPKGDTSSESFSPWREVYLWGNGVNRRTVIMGSATGMGHVGPLPDSPYMLWWDSGAIFTKSMVGQQISVAGTNYGTVISVALNTLTTSQPMAPGLSGAFSITVGGGSTNYTLDPNDQEVNIVTTVAATVTLLSSAYVPDQEFTISNDATSTANVTISEQGGGQIDGKASIVLTPSQSYVFKAAGVK